LFFRNIKDLDAVQKKTNPKSRVQIFGNKLEGNAMKAEQLRTIGARLYGDGLMPRLYIQALARDLEKPESTVRSWWYGIDGSIPTETKNILQNIQNERGRP